MELILIAISLGRQDITKIKLPFKIVLLNSFFVFVNVTQANATVGFSKMSQMLASSPRCSTIRSDAPGWGTHLTSFHKFDGTIGAITNGSTTPATATGFNPGNAATFVNPGSSLSYSGGRFGQSISFNGVTGDYIDMGDTANIQDLANAQGSVMLWLNQTRVHKGALIYKSDNNGNAGWMAFVYPAAGGASTNHYHFEFRSVFSSKNMNIETIDLNFIPNTWNQLIITWDGTTTASQAKIYLNGTLLDKDFVEDGIATKGSDAGYPMKLGVPGAGMISDVGPFQGKIDEIAFWRKQLSPQEVFSLYMMQACKP